MFSKGDIIFKTHTERAYDGMDRRVDKVWFCTILILACKETLNGRAYKSMVIGHSDHTVLDDPEENGTVTRWGVSDFEGYKKIGFTEVKPNLEELCA